jgi:hypothetical protein
MAQQSNRSQLDSHADEEATARIVGDVTAGATSFMIRQYIPRGATVQLPSRWAIVVSSQFEIEEDASLEIADGGILEVL